VLAGLGSGQAGNFCGTVENVVAVDETPAEVPDAFSELWRFEVATEMVGSRAASKDVGFVALDPTPLSVTTSAFSILG
jgi:hypothetical protein